MKDKQSSGLPWIQGMPKAEKLIASARESKEAFDALQKSVATLLNATRMNEQLSFEIISLYKHRYEIEKQAAIDYKKLYEIELNRRAEEQKKSATWQSTSAK